MIKRNPLASFSPFSCAFSDVFLFIFLFSISSREDFKVLHDYYVNLAMITEHGKHSKRRHGEKE